MVNTNPGAVICFCEAKAMTLIISAMQSEATHNMKLSLLVQVRDYMPRKLLLEMWTRLQLPLIPTVNTKENRIHPQKRSVRYNDVIKAQRAIEKGV